MLTPRDFARALRKQPTEAERRLWQLLRGKQLLGFRFRRQVPLGPYILDFVSYELKLVIELDGGQHAEQQDYDQARTRWLESQGFTVLRFWNHEVLGQTGAVCEQVFRVLTGLAGEPPHPSPPPRGGRE